MSIAGTFSPEIYKTLNYTRIGTYMDLTLVIKENIFDVKHVLNNRTQWRHHSMYEVLKPVYKAVVK